MSKQSLTDKYLSETDSPLTKHSSSENSSSEESDIGEEATGNDKTFLERALEVAKKSEDPETKVITRMMSTITRHLNFTRLGQFW